MGLNIGNEICIFVNKQGTKSDMQAIDMNTKLVDGYLELLKNLSPNNKLDLIAKLSDSLKSDKIKKDNSLKSLQGDFIAEKSADNLIDDLRTARSFKRNTESF